MLGVLGTLPARPFRPVCQRRGAAGAMSMDTGPQPDEAEVATDLVRRIAAGDTVAEGQLVERYSRGILYLLRRLGAPPEARRRPSPGNLSRRAGAAATEGPRRAGRAGWLPPRYGAQPDGRRPAQGRPPQDRSGPRRAGAGRSPGAGPALLGPPRRGGRDRAAAHRRSSRRTATGRCCCASTSPKRKRKAYAPIWVWTACTSTVSSSGPASASKTFWSASRRAKGWNLECLEICRSKATP